RDSRATGPNPRPGSLGPVGGAAIGMGGEPSTGGANQPDGSPPVHVHGLGWSNSRDVTEGVFLLKHWAARLPPPPAACFRCHVTTHIASCLVGRGLSLGPRRLTPQLHVELHPGCLQ